MKKNLLLLSAITTLCISCGQSKDEKIEQAITTMDSTMEAGRQKSLDEDAASNQPNPNVDEVAVKSELLDLETRIETAEKELEELKNWKLGRSESEKEQQIADKMIELETLKDQKTELEKMLK